MKTENQILEDNEAIAVFMGFYKCRLNENSAVCEDGKYIGYTTKDNPSCGWFRSELQYNSSWNWLMEVIEKIDSLPYVRFTSITKNKTRIWFADKAPHGFIETPWDMIKYEQSFILKCHAAIVEFIKWYNSQNPNP